MNYSILTKIMAVFTIILSVFFVFLLYSGLTRTQNNQFEKYFYIPLDQSYGEKNIVVQKLSGFIEKVEIGDNPSVTITRVNQNPLTITISAKTKIKSIECTSTENTMVTNCPADKLTTKEISIKDIKSNGLLKAMVKYSFDKDLQNFNKEILEILIEEL